MATRALRTTHILAAVALGAGLLVSGISPASAAPAMLSFTINESLTNGSIELGTPNGAPSCTGEGDSLVCVQPMGISTSYRFNVSITESGTGAAGRMIGQCAVMYAGQTTSYATRTGSANATGSEDCDLHFVFGADEAWGGMHEARVLVDNMETNTFTLTMTRGLGKFAGLSGVLSMTESNPWTAPPPIGDKPAPTGTGIHADALRAIARTAVAVSPRADEQPAIGVPLSTKTIVDVTSLGLLAPVNASAKAAVSAAAGSTCRGTMSSTAKTIPLPAKKVSRGAGSVILKTFSAGSLKGVDAWNLHVTCTLKGKATTIDRSLTTFAVVPNAPV